MKQNKILLFFLVLISVFIVPTFASSTEILHSCMGYLSSPQSDTTYILAEDFSFDFDSGVCFVISESISNVVFDGNFTKFIDNDFIGEGTVFQFTINLPDDSLPNDFEFVNITNFTIKNFEINFTELHTNTFITKFLGSKKYLSIKDFYFTDNLIIGSSIFYTAGAPEFFGINHNLYNDQSELYFYGDMQIKNNYIKSLDGSFWRFDSINPVPYSSYMNFYGGLILENNDFEGIKENRLWYLPASFFKIYINYYPSQISIYENFEIKNNNFAFYMANLNYPQDLPCYSNGTKYFGGMSCTGGFIISPNASVTYTNNYVGSYVNNAITDSNSDKLSDQTIIFSDTSGNIFFNGQIKTYSLPTSTRNPEFNSKVYINRLWSDTDIWENKFKKYILTDKLSLNSSAFLNWDNDFIEWNTLDLSHFVDSAVITLTNTNQIRMGNNNIITGYNLWYPNLKPKIQSTGLIDIGSFEIATPWATNWAYITFNNNDKIEYIHFDDNALGNHGILRKKSVSSSGEIVLYNNYFDFNTANTLEDMPYFYIGFGADIQDNTFDWGAQDMTNNTIFFGGQSGTSNIRGGHIFEGNNFSHSGYILNKILEYGTTTNSSTLYPSIIYNNYFGGNYSGSDIYAFPFNPFALGDPTGYALMYKPNLNFSLAIYQPNVCDLYYFNIGNFYKYLSDAGTLYLVDNNSDDISDLPQPLGFDILGNAIIDYRILMEYPYDYDSNIAQALNQIDLCGNFAYNIISPVYNNTYGGNNWGSSWSYTSDDYDNLYCEETIGDDKYLISPNASPSLIYGYNYNITGGNCTWRVTCCNDYTCTGLKKESDIISFCVGGTCEGSCSVSSFNQVIWGCTNSSATNYNPLATNNDGSCIYSGGGNQTNQTNISSFSWTMPSFNTDGLFSSDFDESKSSFSSLLKTVGDIFVILFWIALTFVLIILFFFVLYLLILGITIIWGFMIRR